MKKKKPLTPRQMAMLRWKGTTKAQRSAHCSMMANRKNEAMGVVIIKQLRDLLKKANGRKKRGKPMRKGRPNGGV